MKNDEPNEAETIMHPYILCMFGCIFPDSVLFFSVQLKKKKEQEQRAKICRHIQSEGRQGNWWANHLLSPASSCR